MSSSHSLLQMLGVGYAHPPTVIDNKFLLSLGLDTNEEWIIEKIGIRERRSVLSLDYIRETRNADPRKAIAASVMTPTDLGVQAARMACERANITPDQIGLVICDCCFPNQGAPTEAQRIAVALGCDAIGHDVLTACPAFSLHVDYLCNYREDALPDYVLAVTTAALTQTVNYTDRTDPAIWGDGAAACIFSPRKEGKLSVIYSSFDADPRRNQAVVVDRYSFFHQDGRAVRDFSVRQTVRMLKFLEEKFSLDWNKDVFIGHQANATMLGQITNNRDIPASQHWTNAEWFGNQASAGAPIVLGMNWEKINAKQRIVISVLGAGLSWGSVVLEAN